MYIQLFFLQQRKYSQRAAEDEYCADSEHKKAVSAAKHGGMSNVIWLCCLRESDNGADNGGADCACKLQECIHGCIAVSVEFLWQLAEAVGHDGAHGKALAEGEEEVEDDKEQRA